MAVGLPSKNIRHGDENHRPESLRPVRSDQCRLLKQRIRIDSQRLQALPQHLPSLAKSCFGYPLQRQPHRIALALVLASTVLTDEELSAEAQRPTAPRRKEIFASLRHPASTDSRL